MAPLVAMARATTKMVESSTISVCVVLGGGIFIAPAAGGEEWRRVGVKQRMVAGPRGLV